MRSARGVAERHAGAGSTGDRARGRQTRNLWAPPLASLGGTWRRSPGSVRSPPRSVALQSRLLIAARSRGRAADGRRVQEPTAPAAAAAGPLRHSPPRPRVGPPALPPPVSDSGPLGRHACRDGRRGPRLGVGRDPQEGPRSFRGAPRVVKGTH